MGATSFFVLGRQQDHKIKVLFCVVVDCNCILPKFN